MLSNISAIKKKNIIENLEVAKINLKVCKCNINLECVCDKLGNPRINNKLCIFTGSYN